MFHLTVGAAAGAASGRRARTIRRASSTSARSTASASRSLENYSYSASKAAVHMLTRHLAKRLAAEHITVNAIAPGPFESKMMAFMLDTPEKRAEVERMVPLGRIGRGRRRRRPDRVPRLASRVLPDRRRDPARRRPHRRRIALPRRPPGPDDEHSLERQPRDQGRALRPEPSGSGRSAAPCARLPGTRRPAWRCSTSSRPRASGREERPRRRRSRRSRWRTRASDAPRQVVRHDRFVGARDHEMHDPGEHERGSEQASHGRNSKVIDPACGGRSTTEGGPGRRRGRPSRVPGHDNSRAPLRGPRAEARSPIDLTSPLSWFFAPARCALIDRGVND